jgi:hypothetical protein
MSAAGRRKARPVQRDQQESAFAVILADLVGRIAGARAAALVDFDGETVDYTGQLDPFELKLAAAYWRIVLHQLGAAKGPSRVRWLWVRTSRSSFLMNALPEGYALAVVLGRGAGFAGWRRAVDRCARALVEEADWTWDGPPPPVWFPLDVVTDSRRRPVAERSGGLQHALDVLGAVAGGLPRRERAWRVRFDSGVEATLVREPGGVWYVDEPPEARHTAPVDSRPSPLRPTARVATRVSTLASVSVVGGATVSTGVAGQKTLKKTR